MRLANLLMVCEARRTGASPQSEGLAKPARPEAKTEDRGAWGGWRQNDRKLTYVNQGHLLWCRKEKTARPVWREGWRANAIPTPIYSPGSGRPPSSPILRMYATLG
jgi:hypothetical protein